QGNIQKSRGNRRAVFCLRKVFCAREKPLARRDLLELQPAACEGPVRKNRGAYTCAGGRDHAEKCRGKACKNAEGPHGLPAPCRDRHARVHGGARAEKPAWSDKRGRI